MKSLKYINYFNKLKLLLKTISKISLFSFTLVSTIFLVAFFNLLPTLSVNIYLQRIILCIMLFMLISIAYSKLPVIKIPVFQYILKIIDLNILRIFIILKVYFFTFIFIFIESKLGLFTSINLVFFYVIFFQMAIYCSLSRTTTTKEKLIILAFSFLIFIFNIYLVAFIYLILFCFSDVITLNYNSLYKASLLYNNVFEDKNVDITKLHDETVNRSIITINNTKDLFLYRVIETTKFNGYLLIFLVILINILNALNLQQYFNQIFFVFICIISTIIIERLTNEDWLMINNKVYPFNIMKKIITNSYLIYILNILLYILLAFITRLINFHMGYVLITLIITTYYIIQDIYLKKTKVKKYIIEFILFSLIIMALTMIQ